MIGLARLLLVLAVALTVVYVSLWFYFRAGARERLQAEWARKRPPLPEFRYVENGLRDYDPGLRRKLLVGVYVIPLTAVIAVGTYLNYA